MSIDNKLESTLLDQQSGFINAPTFHHTWTFDNLSHSIDDKGVISPIHSSHFVISNNVNKGELQVKLAMQTSDREGFFSLFLLCESENEVNLFYKLSVLGRNGEKNNTKGTIGYYARDKQRDGFDDYICSNYLLDSANDLLPNDKLTIFCEGYIIKSNQLVSIMENKFSESLDDLGSILDSARLSDVVLVIGAMEIPAHKAILSARSATFAAMFDSENKDRVEMIDEEVEIFEHIVKYIYSGTTPSIDLYASDLLASADKFQLLSLKKSCEKWLASQLSIESVSYLLDLANEHNAIYLKLQAIEYIQEHISSVI